MSVIDPILPPPRPLPRPSLPGRLDGWWFEVRAACLRLRRGVRDTFDRSRRRHRAGERLRAAPVVAQSRAPLWPGAAGCEEALVLGKIQNLRVARRAFDGVVLARGEVLGFWAQLGRPTRRRGFVPGRELREGCLIPSIGGGLCQLSNALYAAALDAGLEILERHAHSRTIPGSAAAHGRDATVFWNYVDLRVRAPYDCRFEVAMDADTITVRIRAHDRPAAARRGPRTIDATLAPAIGALPQPAPGDCVTCGQDACARNAPTLREGPGTVAVIGPTPMPEHARFLRAECAGAEHIGVDGTHAMRLAVAWLALRHRLRRAPPARRAMALAALQARRAAARLRPEHREVHVDQAWLPDLWRSGALAGRRIHVLLRALPMTAIHARLEAAAARHPGEASLRDFRADDALLRAEDEALNAATRWIGPHAQALALAGARAHPLPWALPAADAPATPVPATAATPPPARAPGPLRVLFPASSLVRKGALELAAALSGLPAELLLPARDGGEPARWAGLPLRRVDDLHAALAACDVVALPAWVEHAPRLLLAAIARGVPVIATPACGLGALPGWQAVPEGDVDALRAALSVIAGALPAPR